MERCIRHEDLPTLLVEEPNLTVNHLIVTGPLAIRQATDMTNTNILGLLLNSL